MKILHVTRSLDPAGGGPAEAIRQLCLAHGELGDSVEVVSLDRPHDPWLRGFPSPVHALGPAHLKYGYTPRLAPWLREHAAQFEAVIVNGLWQYHGFGTWRILRRLGIAYFVFAHGMLDPWFKRTYPFKHLKKWLYWPWADYRLLRDAACVLFTCEEERRAARRSFWLYRCNEAVVGLGIASPPSNPEQQREAFFERFPDLRGKSIYLFLGRIHPKKGCDLLVQAFAEVAGSDPSSHLLMAGPHTEAELSPLKRQAHRLGISRQVSWPGMLVGELKWGAFRTAEAFVLPSHQENFGIAVVEAMACALPVLISDKVNIWREITEERAGFVAPDTLAGTRELLQRWRALGVEERSAMGSRAASAFLRRFTAAAATSRLAQVLHAAPPIRAQSFAPARSKAGRC